MISEHYCREHPEWAARRIDELESQIVNKFFTSVCPPVKGPWQHATQEQIDRALAFADGLDYSYGYTQWVDSMKALAVALRTRSESAAITPEQKAAWRGLEKCVKDTVSGSFLAFAAMMEKDYGISRAQAVEMMDIAYDVNGATK